MRDTDDGIQPLANLLVLPLRLVEAAARGRRLGGVLSLAHLREGPGRPGGDGGGFGDGDDEGGTAVEEVEDDCAAAWAARAGPHSSAEGRDGREEDEEAVGANVDLWVGFAHAKRVGGFGEELVREKVVAWANYISY